jgi:hypothetical protein
MWGAAQLSTQTAVRQSHPVRGAGSSGLGGHAGRCKPPTHRAANPQHPRQLVPGIRRMQAGSKLRQPTDPTSGMATPVRTAKRAAARTRLTKARTKPTRRPRTRLGASTRGRRRRQRSVTELEPDEVGASLKWATARSNAPASRTATASRVGSGRPSAAATPSRDGRQGARSVLGYSTVASSALTGTVKL